MLITLLVVALAVLAIAYGIERHDRLFWRSRSDYWADRHAELIERIIAQERAAADSSTKGAPRR